MNPQLALAACTLLILVVLYVDRRRTSEVSFALWLPTIWMAILASRPIATWFYRIQDVTDLLQQTQVESSVDRNILLALMVVGTGVLINRRLPWVQWLKSNPWIVVFFLYCAISTLWSDYPGIAFKRWIRAIGALIMILIVLSEKDPVAAIRTLLRRCVYVLVPMSLVLIKYYRSQGVTYNLWTGSEILIGVTTNKNALGRLCLIAGLFLLWDLLTRKKHEGANTSARNYLIGGGMLALTLVLLRQSNSSTSLAAFIVGSSVLVGLGFSTVQRNARFLGTLIVVMVVIAVSVDQFFNITETVVLSLGRDLTFTDRTFIWTDLLALDINPLVGVGYDSFWLGERLTWFVQKHQAAEAHNGYLEAYLELGSIGLLLLIGLLLSVFMKAKNALLQAATADYARFQLAVFFIFIIYNVTEAAYKITTPMAFVLFLVGMQRPVSTQVAVKAPGFERAPRQMRFGGPRRVARVRVPSWQR